MKPTYLDAGKLAWYPDIACPVCGGDVNSWDKDAAVHWAIGRSYARAVSRKSIRSRWKICAM